MRFKYYFIGPADAKNISLNEVNYSINNLIDDPYNDIYLII